ncbi:MAG: DUF4445 domain-containing protein [Deltaproteobacteria bacterium]|nr:DUF4445 domain-containing protein [Deltaproteobacteria bacterium]
MVTDNTTYGVAIDLGTTTIAGSLVELRTQKSIKSTSLPNPQSEYGKDVISRIEAVGNDPEALDRLQWLVAEAISKIIKNLTNDDEATLGAITHITVAGNSVMEHILHGVSPEPMGQIPYRPAFKEPRSVKAKEIGINLNAATELYTLPMVGGFVGGDAVAATVALGIDNANLDDGNILAIDIGTNTEIILSAEGRLMATAAAAGPAFEGGEIASGMTAEAGAISAITIDGDDIKLAIIGDVKKPKGICGSGLISTVSELLKAGIIDESGRIKDPSEVETNLSTRIISSEQDNHFILYRDATSELALGQADVRALQTAKASIRAGIETLLAKAKINTSKLKKIFITGAFGSNIYTSNLFTIGLLDADWKEQVEAAEIITNAALQGAEIALTKEGKERIEGTAKNTTYVPLSGTKGFEADFIEHTNFPSTEK